MRVQDEDFDVTDELWKWDAVALAEGIRARAISSREAVQACVYRMRAVNPQLNAVTCDLSERRSPRRIAPMPRSRMAWQWGRCMASR